MQIKNLMPLIVILFIPLLIFSINWPIAMILWQYGFDDGSYSHAFLIPIIYGYLCFYLHQNKLLHFRSSLSLPFTLAFLFSCYLFFVMSTAQITLAYLSAHLLLIITTTTLIFKFNWKLIFPAFYLIFMYTIWAPLVPVLQNMSVIAVSFMMGFTDIPTYVEEQFVTIPAGIFEIAGGCSGLRYMITALSISSLYIFLYLNKVKHAVIFLFVAILGALLTNWIRITIIILIGHYTEMKSELINDHNMFGWYLFIPFMYLLFQFGNRLVSDSRSEIQSNTTNSISTPIIIIMTLGLVFSSALMQLIINITHEQNQLAQPSFDTILYPIIKTDFPIKHQIKTSQEINFSSAQYKFNATNLDAKPTHFNNQLFNETWTENKRSSDVNWNTIELINKTTNKKAIIAFSYLMAKQREKSKNKFKIKRLKAALLGKSTTQIDWLGTVCHSDCKKEKLALTNIILKANNE